MLTKEVIIGPINSTGGYEWWAVHCSEKLLDDGRVRDAGQLATCQAATTQLLQVATNARPAEEVAAALGRNEGLLELHLWHRGNRFASGAAKAGGRFFLAFLGPFFGLFWIFGD